MPDNEQKFDVFDESSAPPLPPPRSKMVPIVIGIAVVAIVAIASILFFGRDGGDGGQAEVAAEPAATDVEPVSTEAEPQAQTTPAEPALPPVEDQRVLFGFDRSDLTSSARGVLQGLCTQLEDRTGTVTLDGYADSIGSEEYNRGLSLRRARAVSEFLQPCVGQEIGIQANGHGELTDDGTAEQRRQNRRVDIQFEPGG